ncbi:fructokinase [Kitasatospora sp. MMS16-BH015]|uniref:carbohydrate kinase family protein n=1 Tax=Kitasatospora sp. MMS16-BH015 TaxID=2018025 RepID=UPI000CA0D0D2|nr:carbohydrate kinase [Kitasatospora sp. MMS16-BH015]AUG78038.1 fructokinase [Kitasatospora sp. MMS16-BH015]
MSEFLVIGESVADIVRRPGEPEVTYPGGSPANVAYGLARLGRATALLTELGQDPGGRLIAGHLAGGGVEVLAAGGPGQRTSSAVVTLDGAGKPAYQLDVHWTLDAAQLPPRLGELRPSHVHVGSVAALLAPGGERARALAERLAGGASVSYDPNVRPALLGEPAAAVSAVERWVALAGVVKASDEDVAWLYPGRSLGEVAGRWLESGVGLVLLTRGAEGAEGHTRGGARAEVPAAPAEVADTVGAGDAFMAATLDALATRGLLGPLARPALAALTEADLTAVLGHAARAAALTVSRPGANPPNRAELPAG